MTHHGTRYYTIPRRFPLIAALFQDLLWKMAVGREKSFDKEGQKIAGFLLGKQHYTMDGKKVALTTGTKVKSSRMSEAKMAKIRETIRASADSLMKDTSSKLSELKNGLNAEVERREMAEKKLVALQRSLGSTKLAEFDARRAEDLAASSAVYSSMRGTEFQ
jgi:hypothetical protein